MLSFSQRIDVYLSGKNTEVTITSDIHDAIDYNPAGSFRILKNTTKVIGIFITTMYIGFHLKIEEKLKQSLTFFRFLLFLLIPHSGFKIRVNTEINDEL